MKKQHIGTALLILFLIIFIVVLVDDLGYRRDGAVYQYTYMHPGTAQVISGLMVDTCDQNTFTEYPINSVSSDECSRYYGNVSYPPLFYYGPGVITAQ